MGPYHKENYTAQDIERYYSGQMPAEEMHALEKAALEDPFLADALDGYKFTPTPAADIAGLKQALAERTDETKVVPLLRTRKSSLAWLRVAALFLFLLGAGWSVYYLMDTKRDTLALDPKESTKPVTAPTPAPENDTTSIQPIPVLPDLTVVQPQTIEEIKPTLQQKPFVEEQATATEDAMAVQPTAAPPPAEVPMLLRADTAAQDVAIVQPPVQNRTAGIESRAANLTNNFTGRVVDPNNRGIPQASVSLKNSNTGTTTDERGYFSLNTPDTTVTARVGAVGFEGKDITLNNRNTENNIVLKESTQNLEEVVVTGVGAQKRRSMGATNTAASLSEPVEGWLAFHNYVAQNRNTPKDADGAEASGSVTLTFTVNRQGTPTNIKVETASTSTLVTEAIRLLKGGPKWDRKKGNRGRVTINFE